jgi:hypothetical protein
MAELALHERWYRWAMGTTEAQYGPIEGCYPRQRGNVSLSNLQVLNAILYVAENGYKWRGLPAAPSICRP